MDADIEKCFDRINHSYLLDKIIRRGPGLLNQSKAGLLGRQIKSCLKSGVIDQDIFQDTTEGIPQIFAFIQYRFGLYGIAVKGLRWESSSQVF